MNSSSSKRHVSSSSSYNSKKQRSTKSLSVTSSNTSFQKKESGVPHEIAESNVSFVSNSISENQIQPFDVIFWGKRNAKRKDPTFLSLLFQINFIPYSCMNKTTKPSFYKFLYDYCVRSGTTFYKPSDGKFLSFHLHISLCGFDCKHILCPFSRWNVYLHFSNGIILQVEETLPKPSKASPPLFLFFGTNPTVLISTSFRQSQLSIWISTIYISSWYRIFRYCQSCWY